MPGELCIPLSGRLEKKWEKRSKRGMMNGNKRRKEKEGREGKMEWEV